MAEKRNPKDINKKLRSLTKEQANALSDNLNSVYEKPKATMYKVSRFDDDGFGIHNLTRPGEPYQENGPEGVDRWTSNGHGLDMGEPVITLEQASEIDAAADQATQASDSI